ncbi:HAD hydrolase-like protein [Streptomyces sp. NC-S4]
MIVANGSAAQQEAKIGRAGLDRLAVNTVGVPLSGAWAIGDSPHADIVGANALGLRSPARGVVTTRWCCQARALTAGQLLRAVMSP